MIARVIHIWNTAGIGGLLARYLDCHYDFESVAIARASHDPFGLATEKTLVWKDRSKIWLLRCAWKARNYDIIHIHSGIEWMPFFRRLFPRKKIVLHLHGTKIRGIWDDWSYHELADMILVSTKDLLDGAPDRVLWLPNPVDEELVFLINNLKVEKEKGWAFHVCRFAIDKAKEYADLHGLGLNLFNREALFYNHEDFLAHLNQFEYYIDVKRDFPGHKEEGKILEAPSMTGLEALALGCKVIDWEGKVHEGLPLKHRSESVATLLNGFYDWGWK